MRLYDLVVITRPSLSDAQRKKVLAEIKDLLKGIKVTREEDWGQKPLAYKIKKELAGVYHLMQFEAENTVPAGFEKRLVNDENIIRHLLIRAK
jgi:small subunit ribosomal protein S6